MYNSYEWGRGARVSLNWPLKFGLLPLVHSWLIGYAVCCISSTEERTSE